MKLTGSSTYGVSARAGGSQLPLEIVHPDFDMLRETLRLIPCSPHFVHLSVLAAQLYGDDSRDNVSEVLSSIETLRLMGFSFREFHHTDHNGRRQNRHAVQILTEGCQQATDSSRQYVERVYRTTDLRIGCPS